MSKKLQSARGTKDILPDEFRQVEYVINKAKNVAATYGFESMATPIFEFTEVYKRTLGDVSDIVSKEMYCFEDRGGESITLRPEFTAGIARAFISNGMTQNLPLKLFSTGPLFRYERPQKGRQRQFHQINFEMLGIADAEADAEIISMASRILEALGLSDKVMLELNSLGDKESRDNYRTALVEYFSSYKSNLSEDSLKRLESNPLRILDSKDEGDKEIVKSAPLIGDYYSEEAASFFKTVCEQLDRLKVSYTVNPHLVRGLDYYCHTAFEFTTSHLGSQNAVLAGGRYDNLIEMMGGPSTPAVGFAGGVERLVALCELNIEKTRPVAVIPIGEEAEQVALQIADSLRKSGIYTELGYSGNMSKRMKKASKINAIAAVIFGSEEVQSNQVKLKWFDSSEEQTFSLSGAIDAINAYSKA